jgi:hypothetical protein
MLPIAAANAVYVLFANISPEQYNQVESGVIAPEKYCKEPTSAPPPAGAVLVHAVPSDTNMLPAVPGAVSPVPPLAAGNVPVTAVAKLTFVSVLLEPLIVLLVSVSVLDSVRILVGVIMLDRVAISYSKFLVVV